MLTKELETINAACEGLAANTWGTGGTCESQDLVETEPTVYSTNDTGESSGAALFAHQGPAPI